MPARNDISGSLQQPALPFNQSVLSKFLKIRPKILGALEISIGILLFIFTILAGFIYLLWWPLITILTGTVMVSAACTHNICRVKTSQFLHCFILLTAVISTPFHFFNTSGMSAIFLRVCDILIFVFSLIVVSSSCECCRTRSRDVRVSYVNTTAPNVTVNNFVVHPPYAPPPIYSPVSSAPPPSYSLIPSVPPPNYTLPSEPPPYYTPFPTAPSLNHMK